METTDTGTPQPGTRIVRAIMQTRVVTIRESDDIALARQVMLWAAIRHLPVMRESALVGILSERDCLAAVARFGKNASLRPVRDAMHSPVVTIEPEASLEDAADRMSTGRIGALPVVERGRLIGIVTATDVLVQHAKGGVLAQEPRGMQGTAADVMTPRPVTALASEPLHLAIARMLDHEVRHLPVVDEEGRLVGVLSDRDVRTAVGSPAVAARGLPNAEDESTVGFLMTGRPVVVAADTPLTEVASHFADERVGAIPVVDERERPIGIVSYVDVLRHLLDQE